MFTHGQWNLIHQDGNSDTELWLLHGLGDSSNVWGFLFSDPAMSNIGMTAVDFPGFGKSPIPPDDVSLPRIVEDLNILINNRHKSESIVIVGHSVGGDIGTLLANQCPELIKGIINVEGNLTNADTFFSGEATTTTNFKKWFGKLEEKIAGLVAHKIVPESYILRLKKCNPQAFQSLAKSVINISGNKIGEIFAQLPQKKSFWYGTSSLSNESHSFINDKKLDTVAFTNAHHWPMFDDPVKFRISLKLFLDLQN